MIEVNIIAVDASGPPVVTTPNSINQADLTMKLGPIAADLMKAVEEITRIKPFSVTISIHWSDGQETLTPPDAVMPGQPVPKWMS